MAQILNIPTASRQLASRFGSPILESLQSMTDMQVKNIQKQKERSELVSGLSALVPKEQAKQLSMLPPEVLKVIAPQLIQSGRINKYAASRGIPGNQPEMGVPETGGLQGLQSQAQEMPSRGGAPQGGAPQGESEDASKQDGNKILSPDEIDIKAKQSGIEAAQISGSVTEGLRTEREVRKDLNKQSNQAKRFAFSETKSYRNDVNERARTARQDLEGLRTQKDLIKGGKLMGNKAAVFVDKIGDILKLSPAQIAAFKNDESVVFEKLSIPYFRSLKKMFGAKPTQWDAQQIAKSFPSLYQSKEGRMIITSFMEMQAKNDVQEKRIKDQVIMGNKGVPPLDLDAQVDKQLEDYRGNQYDKFRTAMDRELVKNGPPDSEARRLGKDQTMKNKHGVVFVSDGKRWTVLR